MIFLTKIPLSNLEKKQRQKANKCYRIIRTLMIRYNYTLNDSFILGIKVVALYMVTYNENDIIKTLTNNFVETLEKIRTGLNISFRRAFMDFIFYVYEINLNSLPESILPITLQDIESCKYDNRRKLRQELCQYYYYKIRTATIEKRVQENSIPILIPQRKK